MEAHLRDLRAEDATPQQIVIATGERLPPDADPSDVALAEFARQLTLRPGAVREEDIATLRDAGLDDCSIHDAAQVIALFNYYNRIASGLGVPDEPEWSAGPDAV